MIEVYIDEIFFTNFTITLAIIYVTKRLIRSNAKARRLCLGATIGGIYAVLEHLPTFYIMYTLLGKICFFLIMAYIIFGRKKLAISTGALLASTFAFGGAVHAILSATGLRLLAFSVAATFALIMILTKQYIKKTSQEKHYKRLTIKYKDKETTFNALVDTGHTLCDPLTHNPIIIVEKNITKDVIPDDIKIAPTRIRLIPFRSLGTQNGIMTGFRPDAITIEEEPIPGAIIGIYDGKLSTDDTYFGLIGGNVAC